MVPASKGPEKKWIAIQVPPHDAYIPRTGPKDGITENDQSVIADKTCLAKPARE